MNLKLLFLSTAVFGLTFVSFSQWEQRASPMFTKDNEQFTNRPLFWHIASQWKHGTCSVIRKNNYKLIQFLADGKLELYNLNEDPSESTNLVETNKDIANTMLAELVQWRKQNKVPLPPNSVLEF